MKPARFEYVAPRSEDEALAVLAQHGDSAKILAGGQSLIPLMNFRLAQPGVVIDINRLGGLAYVRAADGGFAIGALTRQHALEQDPAVRARLPVLAEACRLIGHLPIRHRGTIGGNLAHGDPASELPAMMVALGAEMVAASRRGRQRIAAERFFNGPLMTALQPDELLAEIRVPGVGAPSWRCRVGPGTSPSSGSPR
jgi:carbon-monoxide dehydrogenase medium subunit